MVGFEEKGRGVCDGGVHAVVGQDDVDGARRVHSDGQHLEARVVGDAEGGVAACDNQ